MAYKCDYLSLEKVHTFGYSDYCCTVTGKAYSGKDDQVDKICYSSDKRAYEDCPYYKKERGYR